MKSTYSSNENKMPSSLSYNSPQSSKCLKNL